MGTLLKEIRYALRTLSNKPGFALACILTLGLGVGATTALFTVLYSVVLRPLPLKDPQRLMMVSTLENGQPRPLSDANFTDFRASSKSFEHLEGYWGSRVTLTGTNDPEVITIASTTTGLLPLLGMHTALGRDFNPDEQNPEHARVAILSDALWRRKFGADRKILGAAIVLDGTSYTVLGALPPGAGYPQAAELWIPLTLSTGRFANRIAVIGRLRDGVSVNQARVEAETIGQQLRQYPENKGRMATAVPLTDVIVGPAKDTIWVMFGAVLVILFIACANVANLQLVRAAERTREIAVRMALGADRSRILRHLFTESVLLAIGGAALGLAFAAWGVDGLLAMKPRGIPRLTEVRVEGLVLVFALLVAAVSAIVFGLWPAWRASKLDLNDTLKQGGRANSSSRATSRLRSGLGVVQIALALILCIGASLLLRSLAKVLSTDLGFRTGHVLSAQFTLPSARYPDEARVTQFHQQLQARLENLPGVISVSEAQCAPLEAGCYWSTSFAIQGQPPPLEGRPIMNHYYVMPKYFSTLGIPLLQGRDFTERELNAPLVIISKRFAREYFAGQDPVGRRIELGMSKIYYEIIGVADDVRTGSIEDSGLPQAYFPAPYPNSSYVIRAQGDATQLIRAVREQIHSMDSELAVRRIQPIEENVREAVAARRFQTWLLTAFASVAAILAVIGIYSVLAYSATQRTQEIGVRLALGAQPSAVIGLFVRQAAALAGTGLAAGTIAALLASRVLAGLLFGITASDPMTYIAVILLFLLVAVAASWIPAWRASRTDPMMALRQD
jgi:putative ABC transport system permease protein